MRSGLHIAFINCIFMLAFVTKATAQISAKTQSEITALLEEKNSRTPAQQKIESQLLQAMRESKGQKMAPGTFLEPVKTEADATGNLEIDIRVTLVDDRVIGKIEGLGGRVTYEGWGFGMIRARVNFNIIESIAALPEVKYVARAERANVVGTGLRKTEELTEIIPYKEAIHTTTKAQRAAIVKARLSKYFEDQRMASLFTGSVNSEGDHAHRADEARNVFGVQGQGIKIGVISDSYGRYASQVLDDIASGNLPGPGNPYGNTTAVTVVQDYMGTDEGRAMMQIVHDVAPKAQLFFATANVGGQAGFAANILALRNTYGCDIIIDDIYYFAEAVFQDGTVAQAVNTVTNNGCMFFSSAGNAGSMLRNTSGVYEGDFNDAGSPVFTHPGGKLGTIHNFGTVGAPINGDIVTAVGSLYNLSWSDPAFAATNDYDLFLVSSTGTVKSSATTVQSGTQPAYEQLSSVPTLVSGDRLIVFKADGAAVRAFALNTNRGALTIGTNGQTHGHNSTVLGFGVAATPAVSPGPYPGIFNASNHTESFSSDGPRRMFYNEDGTPITPGNVLFGTNGGTVRNKPDITAADGVSTTLLPSSGLNPFYGTSAAAPHAGAIAALIKSANPALTAAQIRTVLESTALDIEGVGYDITSGAGIIQAFQAIQSLSLAPLPNINLGTTTATENPGQNNSGYLDPGETGNLLAQLKNSTAANATTVAATLSTTTSGVTITQNVASYGDIGPSGNATNTGAPFQFSIASSVPCGTTINFYLTVTFGGGGISPQTFLIPVKVGATPGGNISNTLGTAPTPNAAYTVSSGTINQRLNRFTPVSVCGTQKANPGLFATTGTRLYHAFTILNSNTADQCVTVTFTAANGVNMYAAAYNNGGFNAADASINFLADQGSSAATQTFSFTAPAGQFFTVVVNEVTTGTATNSPYNLNISLATCTPAALPLTWLDFTAQPKNGAVGLQWKVANELNLSHYEVEYGTDGRRFAKLFDVSANTSTATNKTYNQMHLTPIKGDNYYRVKQVDKDGRSSYSDTKLVKMSVANDISVSPNPATSVVYVRSATAMKNIKVYNAVGQLVMTANPGSTSYDIEVSKLPSGTYSVSVETGGTLIVRKLVKE